MNRYFIDLLEEYKSNSFKMDAFHPEGTDWESVKLWYYKYSDADRVSDKELLELLYFFYVHDNLVCYDNVRFAQVAGGLSVKYRIDASSIMDMFLDFCKIVYE